MMRKDTIYRSHQNDRIECAVFRDEHCIHSAFFRKGESSPVYLNTLGIRLMSGYDIEQTLIPGVTKRVVEYVDHDIQFAEIRWNSDETYSIYFPEEIVNIERLDGNRFAFRKDNETLAMISRFPKERQVIEKEFSYEPVYQVESDERISSMCLAIVFAWPLLYFGF